MTIPPGQKKTKNVRRRVQMQILDYLRANEKAFQETRPSVEKLAEEFSGRFTEQLGVEVVVTKNTVRGIMDDAEPPIHWPKANKSSSNTDRIRQRRESLAALMEKVEAADNALATKVAETQERVTILESMLTDGLTIIKNLSRRVEETEEGFHALADAITKPSTTPWIKPEEARSVLDKIRDAQKLQAVPPLRGGLVK